MRKDSILGHIYQIAEKYPNRISIECDGVQLSYRQLLNKVQRVAFFLNKKGIKKEDKVFIYLSRSIDYIVYQLGILCAGGAFVPFDEKAPWNRVEECFIEARGKYIITDYVNISDSSGKIIFSDEFETLDTEINYKFLQNEKEDLAYIIFTSGSTGKPKGVMIEHGCLENLVEALNKDVYKNEQVQYRIAVFASFAFDSSIKQIYYALCMGHTLVIVCEKDKIIGRKIINFICVNNINIIDFTPSLINLLYLDRKYSRENNLQKILIGGEILTYSHVNKLYEMFGNKISLYNLYGPTECCVDVSVYEIHKNCVDISEDKALPIGKCLHGNYFEISQEEGGNVLLIYGKSVGRGYVNGKVFLDNDGKRMYNSGDLVRVDSDGNYIVDGRVDHQIKLNGYRIELEEIDNTICILEKVEMAVSIVKRKKLKNEIITFVKADCLKDEIQNYLRKKLPQYMLPNDMIFVNEVVLNQNGKIDKKYYEKQYLK